MIDKVNNITSGNTQNKRGVDENRVNKSVGENKVTSVKEKAHLILIMLKLVKS